MFSNLKMHFLNSNDVVVYNDVVIGFFNNYRITSNSGVHLKEDRKLTENEMDKFIEKIDSTDIKEETGIDPNDLKEMLTKIVKYHPEIKYIVHGFNEVLAAPRRIEKKKLKRAEQDAAKEKRKEGQRKPRHLRPDPEKPKKEIKPIEVDYGKKDDASKDSDTEEKTDSADVEKEQKEAEQRQKEAEKKRLAEEEKFKKEREEKQNAEKDTDNSPGKYEKVGKPEFSGFLGLMFKMFKGLADPKKKADKEELRKKLRNEYSTYKKNKKWLEENNELINMLSEQVDKKQISLDSISIINEIISRDPTILEEINLESSGPVTKKIPLTKITEELKDFKLEPDESDVDQEKKIKEIFKKHNIDVKDVVIDRDVNNNKIAEVELGGLDSLMRLIDTLSLGRNDLK